MSAHDELEQLRAVALKNAQTVLQVRELASRELLQAKEALEQRSADLAHALSLLRATLDSTADAILVTNNGGMVIDCNQALLRLWGVTRERLVGSDHRRLVGELAASRLRDPEAFIALLAQRYATPSSEADVLYLLDGRIVERVSRSQILDGAEVGRVWTFRDVTERRRNEDHLREESGILEMLNRTGAAIGATLELDALLQSITDAATDLSGAHFGALFYTAIGTDGENVQLFTLSGAPRNAFAQFGHSRATPMFGPTLQAEGPLRIDDVLQDPRYGPWAPHYGIPQSDLPLRSYLAVPVISRGNELIGGLFFGHASAGAFSERAERVVVGVAAQASIAIDNARLYERVKISAQENRSLAEAERQARAEAERVSRMKDEFLATLSHELRTPLNAILGWSQILLRGNIDEVDLKQGLDTIARNAKAQTRLIEDLLDMHRIISGKVRLDVQPTDLANVVDSAVESLRPAADAKEIRLRKIIDPRAGPVSGDPNRLQQVVWNLLSNAIKFTAKQGKVDVLLERVSSHLEVSVVDDGVGIEPAFLPHVFDRFRQADSSTTRYFGGLGLGLSIVRQLVELHGGSVRAESAGAGCGSSFVVSLPLAPIRADVMREHPGNSAIGAAQSLQVDLDGITVLVVDDEHDARELIRRLLEASHARVLTAGSAIEALELVQRCRPDLVLSDIGMPEHDGYHFIRELRALGPQRGGNTPALAITAFARSEDRTRAIMAGYQMHIAKPFETYELLASVASITGRTGRASG